MPRFNLEDYVSVHERIEQFWRDYPDGRITTELISDPNIFERVVVRAAVYKHRDHPEPDATDLAAEEKGQGGMANATSWHENAATSAIGRALANLGYATSAQKRPSREEMAKANGGPARAQNAPHSAPQAPERPANVTTLPAPTLETRDTFLTWMTKNGISSETVLGALGTESLGDWLKANPGQGWAGLKKVVEDAGFPAPAEASS
jgi:hypothetical protein